MKKALILLLRAIIICIYIFAALISIDILDTHIWWGALLLGCTVVLGAETVARWEKN